MKMKIFKTTWFYFESIFLVCHILLLSRIKHIAFLSRTTVFCVVSCCLDYDINLILNFSENIFDLLFCHAMSLMRFKTTKFYFE